MRRWTALALLLLSPVIVSAADCSTQSCVYVPQVGRPAADASPSPSAPSSSPRPSASATPRPSTSAAPSASPRPSASATPVPPTAVPPTPVPPTPVPPTPTTPPPPNSITWTTMRIMPIARHEAMGATVGGRLFVFGGYTYYETGGNRGYTPTPRAHVFDPATDQWSELASMPVGLSHAGVAVDGRNIYVAGGYPIQQDGSGQNFSTVDVWRYNVDDNQWYESVDLPQARGAGSLALVGRSLHFFGGTTGASSNPPRADQADHWALNLDNLGAGWQTRAPMLTARNHMGVAALNGLIYAIGGDRGIDEDSTTQTLVEVYNPGSNSWSTAAPLPEARSHISGATMVVDGRIFVIAGDRRYTQRVDTVTMYTPQSNSWSALTPLPEPRSSGVAGYINGDLLYSSGANASSVFTRTTYRGDLGALGARVLQQASRTGWLDALTSSFAPVLLSIVGR